MYINTLGPSKCLPIERVLIGTSKRAQTITTVLGEYKGLYIAIDTFRGKSDETIQKRYKLWNNDTQIIWYKNRREDGRFELIL